MNKEIIIPVATLILGWLLSELSTLFRKGSGRKEVMSQTICQFLLHLDELRMLLFQLRTTPEIAKQIGSNDKAIELLHNSISCNSNKVEKRVSVFKSLAQKVSGYDPVLGYKLFSFMPDMKDMDFIRLGKSPSGYSKALSMQGGFIAYYIDEIESLCKQLALRCSFICYVRVWIHLHFLRTRTDSFKDLWNLLDKTFGSEYRNIPRS